MSRFEALCPGCGKRIHRTTIVRMQLAMQRHARNCGPLKKTAALALDRPEHQE